MNITLPCSQNSQVPRVFYLEWSHYSLSLGDKQLIANQIGPTPWVVNPGQWSLNKQDYSLSLWNVTYDDLGVYSCSGYKPAGTDVTEEFSRNISLIFKGMNCMVYISFRI